MSSTDELMLQPIAWDFVSRVGSVRKTNGRCGHAKCLNGGVHPNQLWMILRLRKHPTSLGFNSVQRATGNRFNINQLEKSRILQISISARIWFGTKGSEVQILSPRPILFNNLQAARFGKSEHLVTHQGVIFAAQ